MGDMFIILIASINGYHITQHVLYVNKLSTIFDYNKKLIIIKIYYFNFVIYLYIKDNLNLIVKLLSNHQIMNIFIL